MASSTSLSTDDDSQWDGISKWVEERDKCAKGQAGFRPKHSTIDHCINLRHVIEKVW